MAEVKTKPTSASVEDFINSVIDEQKTQRQFGDFGNDEKSNRGRAKNVGQFTHRFW
ncbi:MAG: hypothetical protein WKF91_03780 [Segetibacter sp.]